MIRRDVQDCGDRRSEGLNGLELEGRDFENRKIERLADQFEGRRPEVPRGAGAGARRAEQLLEQADSGRFSVRSGDRDDRRRDESIGELDITPDALRSIAVALGSDAWARNHQVEISRIGKGLAENAIYAGVEVLESDELILTTLVCSQNARSPGDAEICGAASGRAEPEHQDLLIRDSFHQRSFSVDKATSPRIADTIQKRTTIFCSGQPSFSKW